MTSRLAPLAASLLLAGCFGLDSFKTLSLGAHCGFDVPGWACADGLTCKEGVNTCQPIDEPGGSGGGGNAGSGGGAQGGAGGDGGAGATGGGGTGGVAECDTGKVEACYTGDPATRGVGACMDGSRSCQQGVWGACKGQVLPVAETCDTPVDDDCDGQTNEEGTSCVCAPLSQQPCYEGPPGTEGVGACVGGNQLCAADGKGVTGACNGQVLPNATESCGDAVDDDCDGWTCGAYRWSKFLPVTTIVDLEVDAAGATYVTGYFDTSVDFGGGPVPPGGTDAFLVKYDADGAFQWVKAYSAWVNALSVDAATGETTLVGWIDSNVNFGCGVLNATIANPAGFVARIDASGQCLWSKALGAPTASHVEIVDVVPTADASGLVALGWMNGTFGGFTSTANDVFVHRLASSDGALQNAKYFPAAGNQWAIAIGADPGDQYAIAGSSDSAGYVLDGVSTFTNPFWAMRLDASENVLWAHDQGANITSLAVAPDGEVLVSGWAFAGSTATIGSDTLMPGAYHMGYVARYLVNGLVQVPFVWAANGNVFQPRIAWDVDRLYAGIRFDGIASMGGGVLGPADGVDVAIGEMYPNGSPLSGFFFSWDRFITGTGDQTGLRISPTPVPAVALAIQTASPIDLGGGVFQGGGIGWVFGLLGR